MSKCPCNSRKPYQNCCYPFHAGQQLPKTSLELMRSRYAAYAKGESQYIIETTHPENEAYLEDKVHWIMEIQHFTQSTDFKGLEIVSSEDKGNAGCVTFIVYLEQNGVDGSFKEESEFVREKGKWYYLKGEQHAKGA